MSREQIAGLEHQIGASRAQIELGRALARLEKNRDFQEVILKGYLEDEAIRLVHCRTDPNMQKPDQQNDLVRQIDGVASFKDFLRVKTMLAERAADSLGESEDLLEQLMAGDLDE